MNISKMTVFILWLLIVSFVDLAAAMTVYMNDGSEIEAQSAWKDGDKVYVRINPDLCLDFPDSEVNAGKSGIAITPRKKTPESEKATKKSAPTRSGDIAAELVEVAGHRRDFNDLFGRGGHGEVEQLFADTFTPALAEKIFRRCLGQRLDNRELSRVLAWYKGPVGRKIVEADSIWDYNRREKTLTYVGNDSAPGFKERIDLIGQIEKSTGISEIETRLTQDLMNKMINTVPPNFPDAYEIKEGLKNEVPTLESSRKKLIQNWAYSYRELSMNELGEYLKFLRSATGKKYMAAVREATEEIFKKVALNIENEFNKYVK